MAHNPKRAGESIDSKLKKEKRPEEGAADLLARQHGAGAGAAIGIADYIRNVTRKLTRTPPERDPDRQDEEPREQQQRPKRP